MSLAKRALEMPEKSPGRKMIVDFLKSSKCETAIYTGKSKKITSKKVTIVNKGEKTSKIRDLEGNESTVSNAQLKFD